MRRQWQLQRLKVHAFPGKMLIKNSKIPVGALQQLKMPLREFLEKNFSDPSKACINRSLKKCRRHIKKCTKSIKTN